MNISTVDLAVLDVQQSTRGKAHAVPASKLHDAAQSFEALMIDEMLKTVKESSSDGWLGSEGDNAGESAMQMAQSQFAASLAKNGGLGLTKMIEKSIGHK